MVRKVETMTSSTGPKNRTTPLPPRRRTFGFTLLEMILVMLIICTMLAITAPSLRGFFASRETKDVAEQILALTKYASSQAVAEGRIYCLNFNTRDNAYWLTVQDQGVYRDLGVEMGRRFTLPKDTAVKLDGIPTEANPWAYYIEFDATGRCQPGRIRLINRREEVFTLICPTPTEQYYITTQEDPVNQWF
jgi:type II secretion system protein H